MAASLHASVPARPDRVPGDVLLHPLALGAIAVLLVNDHVLKQRVPGLITGKASDVAGLLFFPLLALAIVEGARKVARASAWQLSTNALAVLVVVTAVVFTAVKVSPGVADVYSNALGLFAWPVRALVFGASSPQPVRVRADVTDLVALPVLFAAWFIGQHSRPTHSRR